MALVAVAGVVRNEAKLSARLVKVRREFVRLSDVDLVKQLHNRRLHFGQFSMNVARLMIV